MQNQFTNPWQSVANFFAEGKIKHHPQQKNTESTNVFSVLSVPLPKRSGQVVANHFFAKGKI
jgi:phosphatidylglycerophosphatase A